MLYEIGQLSVPEKGAAVYTRISTAPTKRIAVNIMRERQTMNRNTRTTAVVGIWCATSGRLYTAPHK